jgi:two-component system, LuxR family, response regulator FixJ
MTRISSLIAVIDDEEPVRKAMDRLLRSVGFEVETFEGGEAFLRSLERRVPDCAVLDLHMPQVTGFDVQAGLAVSHPRLPVIIVTGHDTMEARDRAMTGGAKEYLRKPVDDKALLAAIANALGKEGPAPVVTPRIPPVA